MVCTRRSNAPALKSHTATTVTRPTRSATLKTRNSNKVTRNQKAKDSLTIASSRNNRKTNKTGGAGNNNDGSMKMKKVEKRETSVKVTTNKKKASQSSRKDAIRRKPGSAAPATATLKDKKRKSNHPQAQRTETIKIKYTSSSRPAIPVRVSSDSSNSVESEFIQREKLFDCAKEILQNWHTTEHLDEDFLYNSVVRCNRLSQDRLRIEGIVTDVWTSEFIKLRSEQQCVNIDHAFFDSFVARLGREGHVVDKDSLKMLQKMAGITRKRDDERRLNRMSKKLAIDILTNREVGVNCARRVETVKRFDKDRLDILSSAMDDILSHVEFNVQHEISDDSIE